MSSGQGSRARPRARVSTNPNSFFQKNSRRLDGIFLLECYMLVKKKLFGKARLRITVAALYDLASGGKDVCACFEWTAAMDVKPDLRGQSLIGEGSLEGGQVVGANGHEGAAAADVLVKLILQVDERVVPRLVELHPERTVPRPVNPNRARFSNL